MWPRKREPTNVIRYQVQATVKAIITPWLKGTREGTVLLEPNESWGCPAGPWWGRDGTWCMRMGKGKGGDGENK